MKAVFHIVRRYLVSKNKRTIINIIFYITLIGVVIGSTALFTVLSGFKGLKDITLNMTGRLEPDIRILNAKQKYITTTQDLLDSIKQVKGVKAIGLVIEEKVLVNYGEEKRVVFLKGVDSLFVQQTGAERLFIQGHWPEVNSLQVAMGAGLAILLNYLPLYVYEHLNLIVLNKSIDLLNPYGSFDKIEVSISGTYQTLHEDLNSKYLFTSLSTARTLLNMKETLNLATSIELWVEDNAHYTAHELTNVLGDHFLVKTREALNPSLYKVINTEHLMVYLVFTFILIIAAFNLSGLLVIIITDKRKDIQTFHILGLKVAHIKYIFLLLGVIVSLLGGMIGVVMGTLLVLVQKHYKLLKIHDTMSYPVALTIDNVLIVLLTIVILGFLASFLSTFRINNAFLKP